MPEAWLAPDAPQPARISATVHFQEKWQPALTLLWQVRTGGITVTAVLGDAEFGDNAAVRRTLHRARLCMAPIGAALRRPAEVDIAHGLCGDHGDSHGAFLRDASALLEHHAQTQGNLSLDLTKYYLGRVPEVRSQNRLTLSKMTSAVAVQTNGVQCSL